MQGGSLLSDYLLNGKVDVSVELRLRVHGLRNIVMVTLQEKMLEHRRVFLFEHHHHLVAQSEQHQLREKDVTLKKKKSSRRGQRSSTCMVTMTIFSSCRTSLNGLRPLA